MLEKMLAGRKKKKQQGLVGGFTVIAMFAQLFLSKLAFLAGAAFIISKIALIISLIVCSPL